LDVFWIGKGIDEKFYFVLSIVFVHSLFAQSHLEEMMTDKPDVIESAVTVPLHFIQIYKCVTVLVRNNIQLDLYAGNTILSNSLNWFWGTGISLSLPE